MRADLEHYIRQAQHNLRSWRLSDLLARAIPGDITATTVIEERKTFRGVPMDEACRLLEVWLRRGGNHQAFSPALVLEPEETPQEIYRAQFELWSLEEKLGRCGAYTDQFMGGLMARWEAEKLMVRHLRAGLPATLDGFMPVAYEHATAKLKEPR